MKIETEFDIADRVKIKPLEVEGHVVSIRVDCNSGVEYEVRCFVGTELKYIHFREDELETFSENSCGF